MPLPRSLTSSSSSSVPRDRVHVSVPCLAVRKTRRVQAPEPRRVPEPWALPAGAGVRACVCVSMKPGFIALYPSQRHKPWLRPGVSVSVQSMFTCSRAAVHFACTRVPVVLLWSSWNYFFFYIYLSLSMGGRVFCLCEPFGAQARSPACWVVTVPAPPQGPVVPTLCCDVAWISPRPRRWMCNTRAAASDTAAPVSVNKANSCL